MKIPFFHKKAESLRLPLSYIAVLTIALGVAMQYAVPFPQDDHFLYQQFIEALASGKLDLSIPGFHGAGFIAIFWYLISGSELANIQFQQFMSLLLPVTAFFAGRSLFKSTVDGVFVATAVTLMPFVSFVYLRGWTGSAYFVFMLLTIIGMANAQKWTWLPWGLSMITKPFAVILLPLYIALKPKKTKSSWYIVLGLSFLIPLLYMIIQYIQVGHLIVGAHPDLDHTNVWQGPHRILLNLVHSLQILFSVHNYYYPDPALTGPGNLMHTTPLIVFLGLFGLVSSRSYYADTWLPLALLSGAIMGILMNALLDHMDHFYMGASVLLLTFAAVPVLKKHPIWIPLVLATFHFQWFYFYLQSREVFSISYGFFIVPIVIDVMFVTLCAMKWRRVRDILLDSLNL